MSILSDYLISKIDNRNTEVKICDTKASIVALICHLNVMLTAIQFTILLFFGAMILFVL